ncbi:MAG: flagellin [Granulosicoccus sp.]
MAQTINNQLMSLKVQKYLNSSQKQTLSSMHRLSSGLRINSAKDDAAALAIAERMNVELRGMNIGMRNAYDGISMITTAEGGLKQVSEQLQRMRELALQSANGTNTTADRTNLDKEFQALNDEVSRIVSSTTFNGKTLLAQGSSATEFQVGPGTSDTISVDAAQVAPMAENISTHAASLASVQAVDSMIAEIAGQRAYFGAVQSGFESTINNLHTSAKSQSAALGRIMDADFAVESARLAHSQILEQAGLAMSSQANSTAGSVLDLLG